MMSNIYYLLQVSFKMLNTFNISKYKTLMIVNCVMVVHYNGSG